jgi:hypothetical protein
VGSSTEQKTTTDASQASRPPFENKVREALHGPLSLANPRKRKADAVPDLPRFRRGYGWANTPPPRLSSQAALSTESAPPLPLPPQALLDDPTLRETLRLLGDAVRVDTPFDIDKFELLLTDHPNQPFVGSVMKGLREGFWPFDEGEWKLELEEISGNHKMEAADLEALNKFRDKEVAADRWSSPVELRELLPGMKISPMFVVWQNGKPRVVTDHSASGLNDGIPREEARVKYDDMRSFGQALHNAKLSSPGRRIVTFKSDVASAFLNLPAHPLWQLRQIVSVEGRLYIVRRLVFGNRASPRCWCAVSGLMCWIAATKLSITDLHVYMDDYFGWDFADHLVRFRGKDRPWRQVQLLVLWEAIKCPFEDRKQEHGEQLKIIGFWVDAYLGTISLSPQSVVDICEKLASFLATPNRKPPLRDWQRLAGHLNWLLNVLPWGRPALCELYRKTSGKLQSLAGIPLNATVTSDLTWLKDTIPKAIGVHIIDTGLWADSDADFVLWTDASLRIALSFTYAGNGFVYKLRPCPPSIKIDIFFLELIAIMSAIRHVASFRHPPRRLLVFTDSLDSVGCFNSLAASEPLHNAPLLGVAETVLQTGIDIRVRFIEGKKNTRADMLSRLLLDDYARMFPSDRVRLFEPPRELLPARWRECF